MVLISHINLKLLIVILVHDQRTMLDHPVADT